MAQPNIASGEWALRYPRVIMSKNSPLRPEDRKKAAQARRRLETTVKWAVLGIIALSAALLFVALEQY